MALRRACEMHLDNEKITYSEAFFDMSVQRSATAWYSAPRCNNGLARNLKREQYEIDRPPAANVGGKVCWRSNGSEPALTGGGSHKCWLFFRLPGVSSG